MKSNPMRRRICLTLLLAACAALLLSGCRAGSNSAAEGQQTGQGAPRTDGPTTEIRPTESTTEEALPTEPEIPTEPSTEPIPFTEPALEAVPFQAQYVRTDHYVEGAEYPQSRLVRSREELIAFYNEFLGGDSLMRASGPASAVPSEFEFYDEDFFLDRSLIVVRLEEGSGSNRHEVTDVLLDSGAYLVQITRILPGPGYAGTCDMAEWHILIEIPKAEDDVPPDAVNLQLTVSETGK